MSDELSTRDMMKRSIEAVEGVQGRQAHIEKRAMNENMLPHEALRMFDGMPDFETLFAKFEEEQTFKKAMVRNLRTVLRPNITEGKFEKITEQSWAQELKLV